MTIVRRAIKDSQKQERYEAIITAANDILAVTPYQDITLEAVAARVGVARGTLYLYFKTKEELFLTLLERIAVDWYDCLDAQLKAACAADIKPEIEQIAILFTASIVQRPNFVRLMSLLHNILEYNINYERAADFKRNMAEHRRQTAQLLEKCLPFLQPGQGGQLMLYSNTLIIGFMHQAEPAPVVKEILAEQGMEIFHVNFQEDFSKAFRALIYGFSQLASPAISDQNSKPKNQ